MRSGLVGSVILLFSGLGSPLAANETLTPESVAGLRTVGSVDLSPDGTRAVYTLQVPRDPEDEPGAAWTQLWMVAGRDAPRRLTFRDENVSSPAFSPDGRSITFLAQRPEHHDETQIWALDLGGGEARPLTEHSTSIGRYRWSPDGKSIAFVAPKAKSDEEKEAEEKGRDAVVDEGLRDRVLYLFDVEAGTEKELLADPHTFGLEWAPGGRTLIIQAAPTPRTDDSYMFKKLYALPIDEPTPRRITDTPGKLGPMEVSPDGRWLAYLGAVSQNDPLDQSLFVVPVAGGEARNLTLGWKGSAAGLAWLDDATLLLIGVEREVHRFYELDVATGERTVVPWPRLQPGDVAVVAGPTRVRMALSAHSRRHPPELYTATLGEEPRRRSHHSPELDSVTLAKQEVISWTGPDGWEISGVLTWPLDYQEGERYPLVLQIHGGPEGVSLDGWTTRPGTPVQLLAKAGYMVLQPNYRGSMGRGVAFSKADHDDLGGKEFDDVLAGVDALIERGLVDRERVGTGGWSYGGYFSAWAATRHSERFKASIVGAGLTNWIAFTGTTDIPYEMSLVHWNSWWFDQPELHWERSPLAHLDKARTPTLVVHGEEDRRVHPEQGVELYQALRIKGVPTSLVMYPREPHGLEERAHQIDFMNRALDWFQKYLGEGE